MNSAADAPFIIDRDYTYFSPIDLIATFLGIVILLIIAINRKRRNKDLDYYKYYIPAISFKFVFYFMFWSTEVVVTQSDFGMGP